jgi:hypothetical protein
MQGNHVRSDSEITSQSQENGLQKPDEQKIYEQDGFKTFVGLTAGAILFGGVALLAAPVAVPAIATVGAGIGLAASVTAITAGVVVLSAVAGATVGYIAKDETVPAVGKWLEEILSSDKGGGIKSEVGGPSRAEESRDLDGSQRRGEGRSQKETELIKQIHELTRQIDGLNSREREDALAYKGTLTRDLNILRKQKDQEIVQKDQEIAVLKRTNAIYDDLTSSSDDNFLNFLDKYREKAVLNISGQKGSLQDKKNKINAIFESTNYSYETPDQYATFQLQQDFATRKAEIIKAIIANPDFPSMGDEAREATRRRQDSFTTDGLIKRSLIFKTAVSKIISDTSDANKEAALTALALQHGVTGSLQFAGTLQVQKQEVDNIFTGIASIVAAVSGNDIIIGAVVKDTVAGAKAGGAVTGNASTNTPVAIAAAAAATNISVAHFAKTAATAGVDAAASGGDPAAAVAATATAAVVDIAAAAVATANLAAAAAPPADDVAVAHPISALIVAGFVAAADDSAAAALKDDAQIRAAVTKEIKDKTFMECVSNKCDELVQGLLSALRDSSNLDTSGNPNKLIFLSGDLVNAEYQREKAAADAAKAAAAGARADGDAGGRDAGGRAGGGRAGGGRDGGAHDAAADDAGGRDGGAHDAVADDAGGRDGGTGGVAAAGVRAGDAAAGVFPAGGGGAIHLGNGGSPSNNPAVPTRTEGERARYPV